VVWSGDRKDSVVGGLGAGGWSRVVVGVEIQDVPHILCVWGWGMGRKEALRKLAEGVRPFMQVRGAIPRRGGESGESLGKMCQ
jgi:hypothetical protein